MTSSLQQKNDHEIVQAVETLNVRSRLLEIELIAHLGEMERRGLLPRSATPVHATSLLQSTKHPPPARGTPVSLNVATCRARSRIMTASPRTDAEPRRLAIVLQ